MLSDDNRAAQRGPIYRTIFALCYGLGLRAGEASGLHPRDVDTERRLPVVVGGKFGKQGLVPHGPSMAALVADQVDRRQAALLLRILGPSSVLLMRRAAAWLAAFPDGVHVELASLAADLGLRAGTRPNSPIRRTIARLGRFHMADWQGQALEVRTVVAPISERQVARLSPGLVAVHRSMTRRFDHP